MTARSADPIETEDLKRRLTLAAREILECEGLAALSLRGAARACGVSHMAPYRHFASKDEMLAAVAQLGFEALTKALDEAAENVGDLASLDVGVAYVLFACANPSLYRLMFSPMLDPCDRFPELIAAAQRAFQRCIDIVRAHGHDCAESARGELPPPAATATWSLVHGLSNLVIDGLIPLPGDAAEKRSYLAQVLAAAAVGLIRTA